MARPQNTITDLLQFEKHWTEQGIPDNQDMRFLLGFAIGRLFRLGAPREALLRYVGGTLDVLEGAGATSGESELS